MSKTIKILIGAVVTLALGLLLVALLLPRIANLNQVKASLIQQVYKNTGRTMTIDEMRWSILPSISLEIKNVTLSNPVGFPSTPFAMIRKADTGVKLRPLLQGNIEINTIDLEQVELNLIRRADGITNWSGLTSTSSNNKKKPNAPTNNSTTKNKSSKSHNFLFKNFTVGDIAINDVRVHLQDAVKHKNWDFQLENIASKNINFKGKSFPFIAAWNYNSNKLAKPLAAKVAAQVIIGPERQFTVNQIQAQLNEIKMDAQLQITDTSHKAFRTSIQMSATNLAEFANTLGHPLPFADKKAFSHVAANINLVMTDKNFEISQLTLSADGATLNAQANISQFVPLRGDFLVNIDHIDVGHFALATHASTSTETATPAVVATSSTTSLLPSWARQAVIKGQFHINFLKSGKLQVQNITIPLQLANGVITSPQTTAHLYQGDLTANATADLTHANPEFALTTSLNHVDMNNFLLNMVDFNKFAGTGAATIQLHANGANKQTLLSSLTGKGNLLVANGSYSGFDILGALNTASALFSKKAPLNNNASAATAFTQMQADFVVNNGVINNNKLVMNSPVLDIVGDGTINLMSQKLNYVLFAKAIGSIIPPINKLQDAIGGAVPLTLTGTLNNPVLAPDMKKIATEVTEEKMGKVLNADVKDVGKSINKATKDVGKALGKLFK